MPGAPQYETKVRILASDDRIFFGFECKDPHPRQVAVRTMRRDETWGGTGAHPTQRSSKPERYSDLEGAPSKLCSGGGFPNGRCIPQEKSHFKIAADAILGWGARDGARS